MHSDDQPIQETATLIEQHPLTDEYQFITLRAPRTAALARPGQFIHVRIPGLDQAALRRPFSIYDAEKEMLSVVYKRVGAGTEQLAKLPEGTAVDVIGPLGNGFPLPPPDVTPVLVAGGYGVAPLHFLARRVNTPGHIFIGARTAADILCTDAFQRMNWQLHIATEDGSRGTKGYVTEILNPWLEQHPATPLELYACGPDGLLKALGARMKGTPHKTWLSLDKHMVCGVGACLACIQNILQPDGSVAQLRTCHDGPVFEAQTILW